MKMLFINVTMFVSFARTTRFASFPDHLVIQIKKFTFGLDWIPKKLGELNIITQQDRITEFSYPVSKSRPGKVLLTGKLLVADVSIDVPDTLDLSALRATGQQPGEELLPEVAPPPLMTPDVEVKGILGSHGNDEDDSLYSPLLC